MGSQGVFGRRQGVADDRGASAVEFALVAPLLFVLVFGIVDFGVVFGQTLSLNNAARDAARFAVVRQIDGSAGRSCHATLQRARDAAVALGIESNEVGVTVSRDGTDICSVAPETSLSDIAVVTAEPCEGSTSGTDDQLRVETTFASNLGFPIVGNWSFDLAGNGYFRCEYS